MKRIGGVSRYEVSANIVKELNMKATKVFMSNGQTFADALTGSVLAAKQGSPLLLVEPGSLPSPVADVVAAKGTQSFALLGGSISISDTLKNKLADTFAGTGFTVKLSGGNLVLYKTVLPSRRLELLSQQILKICNDKFYQSEWNAIPRKHEIYD